MFFILHRIATFIYLYLLASGILNARMSYLDFLVLDFFSLTIILVMGLWYGIWLGMYWFERVYVEKSHGGFVRHISGKIFPRKIENMENKISHIKERLEQDMWQLEDLVEKKLEVGVKTVPVKRKVVRKTPPKKLKIAK